MPIRYIETVTKHTVLNISRIDRIAAVSFASGEWVVRAYMGDKSFDMSKIFDKEEDAVACLREIYYRIDKPLDYNQLRFQGRGK